MARYVLDTSAVLSYVYDEAGADLTESLLAAADNEVLLPFAALMEVEYKFIRESPPRLSELLVDLANWPVKVMESTPEWGLMAAQVKARGRISFADAWVAALALIENAELVHKDPEFDAVEGLKALRLPYDRNRGTR